VAGAAVASAARTSSSPKPLHGILDAVAGAGIASATRQVSRRGMLSRPHTSLKQIFLLRLAAKAWCPAVGYWNNLPLRTCSHFSFHFLKNGKYSTMMF
jgi:hypothetical protein